MYSGPTSKSVYVTWIENLWGGLGRTLIAAPVSLGRKIPWAELKGDPTIRSLARSALRDGKARSAPSSIYLFSPFRAFSYISL
jgi:hypothetical protein